MHLNSNNWHHTGPWRVTYHFTTTNKAEDPTPNPGPSRYCNSSDQDFTALKPYFAWMPTKMVKNTYTNSTQYGYIPTHEEGNIFKQWKSPQPGMNVFWFHNDLLMDGIYSNVPAIDRGFNSAMIFFGWKSHTIHIEHQSKHKSVPLVSCIQRFVRRYGAPDQILADHASYHQSFSVLSYLWMLWIKLWFSEAEYHDQPQFERQYQTFKQIINKVMDRTWHPEWEQQHVARCNPPWVETSGWVLSVHWQRSVPHQQNTPRVSTH